MRKIILGIVYPFLGNPWETEPQKGCMRGPPCFDPGKVRGGVDARETPSFGKLKPCGYEAM